MVPLGLENKGTSKNSFHSMRQESTQPEKQALALANARVLSKKVRFLEVPITKKEKI
jgi:hypothetical protein